MIYRRKTFKVHAEVAERVTTLFEKHLLPIQLKHGAVLAGRWVTERRDEIQALWEYPSYEEYQRIETAVRNDPLYLNAQAELSQLGVVCLAAREEFMVSTGRYAPPRHILSVAGYITDSRGDVLLVRTDWRRDTWELPGGQVEEGEEPSCALRREILEETGIAASITGLTGVYYNASRGICNLVFRGVSAGGQLATAEETVEVRFLRVDESNGSTFITRPNFRTRVLDAMRGRTVPYEEYRVRPYQLAYRNE